MQIQHTSPPSTPTTSSKPADLDVNLEPGSQPTPDPAPVQDESIVTDSLSDRPVDDADKGVEETVPTDADMDHIQAVADAKVGEHIEGLLDWPRSLSSNEPPPPGAPASDAGDLSNTSSKPQQDADAPKDPAVDGQEKPSALVVDLVSDSDESNSDNEDPDKENDVSLVNATPRLDSDVSLSSFPTQGVVQELSRASSSRHSFVGPLAQKFQRKKRHEPNAESRFRFPPVANGSELGDMSATEQIRSIGRQSRFFQPSCGTVPSHSTPLQNERPSQPDRSFSFSSSTSLPSASAISTTTPGLAVYRKRDPIFFKQHRQKVVSDRELAIKHSIDVALRSINNLRSSRRKPLLHPKQFHELAVKTQKVHQLIAQDNPKHAAQANFIDAMTQRFMRQRQRDAETAVMPVSQVKLQEKERMEREMRARERKIRGILGRQPLPDQMDQEEEQAADSAFSTRGVVSVITGAQVSDFDVQKLRPRQWLNDEVINFYGTLILNRANEADKKRTAALAAAKDAPVPPAPVSKSNKKGDKGKPQPPYDRSLNAFWRVHFFNSFFWTNMKNKGYDGVKRWTRRIDIFSKDIILFPINLGNAHWVCGAINMRKHRFEYYDSLGAFNQSAFQLMRDYVIEEARDKKKKEIDLRGWKDHFSDESPQQENSYDCGVFACQTLEQISRRDYHTPIPLDPPAIVWKGGSLDEGAEKLNLGRDDGAADDDLDDDEYEWNFSQQNMPYLRRRMAYEIYSKQLLD